MSDLSINTNPSSDIFENTYKYPEWYNKKKFIFYNKMLARLKKLSYIHTRASQYYDKMNYYIFGPSITLTAISGIASFLSTSDMIDPESQNGFGIAVGIIASISSVMQSIGGACQFSAKQEGHRSAAEQYNNLIVKTKFEIEMPNEENYADDLEKMILDIQGKCNFFPPQFIVDEYDKKNKGKSNTQEGNYDESTTKPKKHTKRLSKNYDTFNQGNSIDNFSIQNTHDDHLKIDIKPVLSVQQPPDGVFNTETSVISESSVEDSTFDDAEIDDENRSRNSNV